MVHSSDIVIALIAIIFPPAAVAILTGCSCDLLINIMLTLLGFIPGLIHSLFIMWKKLKAEEMYGPNGYTYLGNGEFVQCDIPQHADGRHGHHHHAPPQQYYGSTA